MERMFKKMIKRWKINSQIRRTVKELNQLTERDLADLGIARSDIYRIARETSIRRHMVN